MAKKEEATVEMEDRYEDYDDGDVIVIKKSWLVTALVALVAFGLGAVAGYFVYGYAFSAGRGSQQIAPAAANAPAAPQPTPVPQYVPNVSEDDDPVLGPDNAPVTIVEFSDFQCPYCKRFVDQTFNQLREEYGDQIRIVYRDFPLSSIHPDAELAAEAAECAADQGKFWEMHDTIFANQTLGIGRDALLGFAEDVGLDMEEFTTCLDNGTHRDEIAKDLQDGTSYGVSGTPTFFINGYRLVGAQPIEAFRTLIDQELDKQ